MYPNIIDDSLRNLVFPENFLSLIYLGRCNYNFSGSCASHGAQITDFNIWDRALSEQEMSQWTKCQYAIKLFTFYTIIYIGFKL